MSMRVVLRTLSNLNRLAICSSPRAFSPPYKSASAAARSLALLRRPSRPTPYLRAFSATSVMAASTFYGLKAPLPNGTEYDFEQLKGKVVLVVNVASKWCVDTVCRCRRYAERSLSSGFTPQYKGKRSTIPCCVAHLISLLRA